MRIGVPAEIKQNEYRVGLTPASVAELVHHGHAVTVEHNAAAAIDFPDDAYRAAGAAIAATAAEVFAAAELIVKVKEPQPVEVAMLRRGQLLFTYLHLAPVPGLARSLTDSGVTAIGYETVTDAAGGLPLLAPMSEVAGRMAIQAAAHALEIEQGGRGLLLCGVPGVASAHVVILGGGVVGSNAARMALGLEARVTVLEARLDRLHQIDALFGPRLDAVFSTRKAIDDYVREADVVIGAVLVPGATAPRLVTRSMVAGMRRGAVVVDVAIDQGGCFETSRPTTHANPTYVEEGVVHYCVANMPGAVARTSTLSLNNATLPFVLALADRGLAGAMQHNPHLRAGLNVHAGAVTHPAVASAIGAAYVPAEKALGL
jgi:alanine dehydrogenase